VSYTFQQQVSTQQAAANSIAATLTPSAGDLLAIGLFFGNINNLQYLTVSDGAVGNTYTYAVAAVNGAPGPTAISFTAAPSGTSATLSSAWTGTSGSYGVVFSDGEIRTCTLTNGLTTCTWSATAGLFTGAITGTPTAAANVYTNGNQVLLAFFAQNVAGSATTITFSQSISSNITSLYVGDYSGVATSNALLGTAQSYTNGSSLGANTLSSGAVSGVSVNALLWSMVYDLNFVTNNTTAGTSPTSFTARPSTGVWSNSAALAEDAAISSNVAATFGITADHFDAFAIVAAAFQLAGSTPPPQPSPVLSLGGFNQSIAQ
jgi:hypothetical protein